MLNLAGLSSPRSDGRLIQNKTYLKDPLNKTETLSGRRKLEGKEKTKFSSLLLSDEDYWDLWH
jgi:hypothetical protein